MAFRKRSTLPFALALLLILLAVPLFPTPVLRAQAGSRTFPETGKTVGGKFLQYWTGHGGLAQQGYPISEEIQETSDTDGKIYTVQYFERAVFELHPENQPPNDVLLQLLGVFRYGQTYPQGAPNEVPNQEAGSRAFAETGKRVGGIFLQYWNSHGGLAQQGYPISNEFMEQSALDGKTYKVQYFERAVFELHPENQPPNNVLLSQLGTFRYRAKYGALTAQLSGTGNQTSSPVALKAGLAVLRSVRANDGYYYIDLMDSSGNQIHTIASGSGPRDLSDAVNIPADGNYLLKVQAEGGWTVNISQPKASYAAPAANQKWSGHGYQATPLFSLNAGHAVFHAVNANDSTNAAFKATLFDQDGRHVGDIADASGAANVSTPIEIPANAVFIIQVQSEGDWTIEVQQ